MGDFMYSKYPTKQVNRKQIRKHKIIIEKILGRKLRKNEIVHHKDGNTQNNDFGNLEIKTRAEHMILHNVGANTRFQERYIFRKEKLYDLYINHKMSTNQISDKYNVSAMTIWRNLKKYDIKIRNKREAAIALRL